jgi:hypothetical protein
MSYEASVQYGIRFRALMMDVESGESTAKLLGEVDPKHGKKGNPSLGVLGGSNSLVIGGARMVRAKSVVSLVIQYLKCRPGLACKPIENLISVDDNIPFIATYILC